MCEPLVTSPLEGTTPSLLTDRLHQPPCIPYVQQAFTYQTLNGEVVGQVS